MMLFFQPVSQTNWDLFVEDTESLDFGYFWRNWPYWGAKNGSSNTKKTETDFKGKLFQKLALRPLHSLLLLLKFFGDFYFRVKVTKILCLLVVVFVLGFN